ncbi:hypothetical protein ACHAXA_008254 [Cyclostephanos tholiformis]|uniref:Amino acid transporter transmembrane domain-containing protein n=1 Tax=Cyclostephanos tholiformis TaxID=382380 RepID=A0ABD3RBK2_9STRA
MKVIQQPPPRGEKLSAGTAPDNNTDNKSSKNDNDDDHHDDANNDHRCRRNRRRRVNNGAASAIMVCLLLSATAGIPAFVEAFALGPPATTATMSRRTNLPSSWSYTSSSSSSAGRRSASIAAGRWMATNTPYFLDQATRPSSDVGHNDTSSSASPSATTTLVTSSLAAAAAVIIEHDDYNATLAGNVVVAVGPSTTSTIATITTLTSNDDDSSSSSTRSLPPILKKIVDKVGKIDESRMTSPPEYLNGNVPNLFSNIQYDVAAIRRRTPSTSSSSSGGTDENDGVVEVVVTARRSTNNDVLSSSVLLCGTSLGCGLLFLPCAIYPSGYLPGILASIVAWAYMTMTALLTSELLINRYGETGKARNVGLLELYTSHLGDMGGKVAGVGFLVVSYLVVGVYLGEGGDRLSKLLADAMTTATSSSSTTETATTLVGGGGVIVPPPSLLLGRALFVAGTGALLSLASRYNAVQSVITNFLVPTTLVAFVVAILIGAPTTDLSSLFASTNQHPEVVLNAFPLLFMGWTYHGVVPRVVYDLEGDKDKITWAIVLGSTTALIMYLTWNAMILGNVFGGAGADGGSTMASSIASAAVATTSSLPSSLDTTHIEPSLSSSIAVVSEMAVTTSLVGVVLGFVNEFNDAIGKAIPRLSPADADKDKWNVALLTLLPPAIVSIALGYPSTELYDVDNYQIVDYTGIFGSSVLFMILPALMAWTNRYGVEDPPRPLTVRPMVPLGKIPLGSLYKAAGTLILEQGLEKLGLFEFVREHLFNRV